MPEQSSSLVSPESISKSVQDAADKASTDLLLDSYPSRQQSEILVTGEKNIDKAISMVKKIIAYEIKNSPISYSSSPGAWSDGTIGAVDLHDSLEAMEKAFAWQAADQKWSSMYEDVAKACGISIEDFEVLNLVAR